MMPTRKLQRPTGPRYDVAATTIYRVSGTHAKRRMAHLREPYFSFLLSSSFYCNPCFLLAYKRESRASH